MRLKEADFDKIITDRLVFGKKTEDVAKEMNCGATTISNVVQMFKLVKEQDFDKVATLIRKGGSVTQLKWAANKLGVAIPESVFAQNEPSEKEKKSLEEFSKAPVEVIKTENDALYFIKILEALHKQNELFEQLCDVVIPHWAADLKDNQNANADLVCNRLATAEKLLDCIKVNTRKRGL